jgi:hypothetical protein
MSLGRLGAMCGCVTGQTCTDCQAVPVYSVDLLNNRWGFGAQWAYPTNYDPLAHRRYSAVMNRPGMGAVIQLGQTNASIYQREQAPGMGEITLGGGWTLGDVASLALVVLAGMSVWKGLNGRRH